MIGRKRTHGAGALGQLAARGRCSSGAPSRSAGFRRPACRLASPQLRATRLMLSVVPCVKMTSSRRAGADERLHLAAGLLVQVGALIAQPVNAAMHVGVVLLVGVGDRAGSPAAAAASWRRCRDRPAARPVDRRGVQHAGEDRKVGAQSRRPRSSAWRSRLVMASLAASSRRHRRARVGEAANRRPTATPARRAGSTSADWASAWRRTARSMSSAVNALTSSTGLPSIRSTSIEAEAWLMQQPSPSK